jgi:hypothetical protein
MASRLFGSWGDDNNLRYLHADDDRGHPSGLKSVSPLRRWAGLGEFLVSTLEEYLSCWDAGGRRVGTLPIPEEVAEPIATPRRELSVPSDLIDRVEQLREALSEAPETSKSATVWSGSPRRVSSARCNSASGPSLHKLLARGGRSNGWSGAAEALTQRRPQRPADAVDRSASSRAPDLSGLESGLSTVAVAMAARRA